jgi:hypothetical protein
MIDCTDRPARARGTSEHLLRPCTKVAPKAPTQTMGRFNAVSTVDHLFWTIQGQGIHNLPSLRPDRLRGNKKTNKQHAAEPTANSVAICDSETRSSFLSK